MKDSIEQLISSYFKKSHKAVLLFCFLLYIELVSQVKQINYSYRVNGVRMDLLSPSRQPELCAFPAPLERAQAEV